MSIATEALMKMALSLAGSQSSGDLPICAVITNSSEEVLSQSKNGVRAMGDITAHAEILALRELPPALSNRERSDLIMVVTLEPCPMCAWAIRSAGIGTVVFGAYNRQYGAGGSVFDLLRDSRYGKRVQVFGGVLESECSSLLGGAFLEIRNNRNW